MTNKVAVYKCVIGDYDTVPTSVPNSPGVDFYLFSDAEIQGRTEWNSILLSLPHLSPAAQNRFVKMQPWLLLPQYDYWLYVDGNIDITGDITELIGNAIRDNNLTLGMYQHPFRKCLYSEGAACIKHSRDWFWHIALQVRKYYKVGYPLDNGLYEAGVMLVRNSDEAQNLLTSWWLEYLSGSTRDQIALPFTAWRLQTSITNLGVSDFRYQHKYFRLLTHKKKATGIVLFLTRAVNYAVYRFVPASMLFGIKGWKPEIGEPFNEKRASK
ncbi:MAG: glycosyltransferase domain-containing protein [Burkholderiales bacterium]